MTDNDAVRGVDVVGRERVTDVTLVAVIAIMMSHSLAVVLSPPLTK